MLPQAKSAISALISRGETVATCESLTAGLVAARLADVPGASEVLRGGLITYATDLKTQLAGISTELIDAHGVISARCAEAMAIAAQLKCGASWGIGITGVAGPSEQEGNPAGVVYLGIAQPDGSVSSQRILPEGQTRWALRAAATEPEEVLDGDRATIRSRSAEFAILRLAELLGAQG